MRISILIVLLLLVCGRSCLAEGQPLVLARNCSANYRIVVSAEADVSTKAVADDMAGILKEITGATFAIVTDATKATAGEIIIGQDNSRLKDLGLGEIARGFAEDEYVIRTVGRKLVIAGAPPRGTINGIYGFLQDHLGCRWFTPGCSRIPKKKTLTLKSTDDRQKPAFLWRSTCPPQHWDAAWTVRNRLNSCMAFGGTQSMMAVMGDPRAATIQNYYDSHAFSYIPADLFQQHPDFFAEVDGERVCAADSNQRAYCITNPGFARYMAERLKASLRGTTGRYIVGIGQADNSNYCHCANCKAAIDRVGLAGAYMEFDNMVADEIAKEYPNAIIDTLAYGITYEATPVKLRPNIRPTWCPINMCAAHAMDECQPNIDRTFYQILDKWLTNTDVLQIWYYHYQSDAFMPHMKLFATVKNFKEFQKRGVNGIFVEPLGSSVGLRYKSASDGDKLIPSYGGQKQGEYFMSPANLRHLTSYISCRLMWDTSFDVRAGIREFCEAYYGSAAKEMEQVALLWESVDSYERTVGSTFSSDKGVHQSLSFSPMLKWSVVEKVDRLFDAAEKKAAKNPDRRLSEVETRRVQVLRLTHQLGVLCFAPAESPLRKKAFDCFFPLMEELGIRDLPRTGISEGMSVADFKALVNDPSRISIPGQEKLGANLLSNSGFETEIDADGIPDGWTATGKYMPEEYQLDPAGISVDTTKAYRGKSSVRLTKSPLKNATVAIRQQYAAKTGVKYRMSLRYQAVCKSGAPYIIFTLLDKDGKFLRHDGGARGSADTKGEWQTLSADTVPTADAAFVMVEALFYDDNAEGTAWLDEFTCSVVE